MQPLSELGGAGKLPQLFFVQLEKFADGIKAEIHRVGHCCNAGKIYDAINFVASVASRIKVQICGAARVIDTASYTFGALKFTSMPFIICTFWEVEVVASIIENPEPGKMIGSFR
jgi:hypothetical protein